MRILAFIASVIAAVQVAMAFVYGSSFCPNVGCKVVENLTVISPLVINLLGVVFFQAVFWGLGIGNRLSPGSVDPVGILLVSGLIFDSVLLAYQLFVAKSLCAYCLLIFAIVMALNLLYGKRQALLGLTVLAMTVFSFSILMFIPTGVASKKEPLKTAAYGLKSCSTPTKEIHLLFSSKCSYCENVLEVLANCNSCDLYLNPIDELDTKEKYLENLVIEPIPTFSPEVNRRVIGVLGIDTVPVLVVNRPDGYRFIKGEKKIINYVQHACFTKAEVFYFNPSGQSSEENLTFISEEDGECSVAIDCK